MSQNIEPSVPKWQRLLCKTCGWRSHRHNDLFLDSEDRICIINWLNCKKKKLATVSINVQKLINHMEVMWQLADPLFYLHSCEFSQISSVIIYSVKHEECMRPSGSMLTFTSLSSCSGVHRGLIKLISPNIYTDCTKNRDNVFNWLSQTNGRSLELCHQGCQKKTESTKWE